MSGAADRADFAARVAACRRCPALAGRTTAVVGSGPATGRVLLVGEAPGAREDATGRPFCGPSGALLDVLLARAGAARDDVPVTNMVRCRPPGNRRPTADELAACRPLLDEQVASTNPDVIVALGVTAGSALAGLRGATMAELRAADLHYEGRRLIVTYHPAAAVRAGGSGPIADAIVADLSRAFAGGER